MRSRASCFDADHANRGIAEKCVEQADGVRATTDAGEKSGGEETLGGEDLLARLAADYGLKIADHLRVRVSAEDGAEQVVRGADVGDPIAHGFVDGVFERAAAEVHAGDGGAEHLHAHDVE